MMKREREREIKSQTKKEKRNIYVLMGIVSFGESLIYSFIFQEILLIFDFLLVFRDKTIN